MILNVLPQVIVWQFQNPAQKFQQASVNILCDIFTERGDLDHEWFDYFRDFAFHAGKLLPVKVKLLNAVDVVCSCLVDEAVPALPAGKLAGFDVHHKPILIFF